jgi:hypothetical protein
LYHLVVEAGSLRVLDSLRERLFVKALNSVLGPGHYRISHIERFAPRTHSYGGGRIFVDALKPKDIAGLVTAEKAELRYDTALRFDHQRLLPIGLPPEACSIHGGAESLFAPVAVGDSQPLTDSPNGVRLHNYELEEVIDFLEPRLRIQQLVVLTVL